MKFQYIPIIFYTFTWHWSFVLATPIATVNVNNFIDDWNYKTSPHDVPLLSDSGKSHVLPQNIEVTIPKTKFVEVLSFERVGKKVGNAVRSIVSCPICKLGVGLLQTEVQKGTSFEDIRGQFVSVCVNFKIQIESVCAGIFDVYAPDLLPALKQLKSGPNEICGLLMGEACGDVKNPLHEWDIDLPDVPKPNVTQVEPPKGELPFFKVLHLSDTHYDPHYVVGSVANCEEPLCCRSSSTPPAEDDNILAGKWGSLEKCDSPRILLENMLKHIATEHPDIDYIIWTGDLPPHDIWNQTKSGNLAIIEDTIEQMSQFFPNIPIFPALGNHEAAPAGNLPPPWIQDSQYSVSWLYSKLVDNWKKWLPTSVGNTVLHGAFYSVLVRPGFRIISINTNYCHMFSWWLVLNSTDPAHELKWLSHELQEAENKGEKVHIIGHIPPGNPDCLKVWSKHFNRIVERYESTIQSQFYGHTHNDEFKIFYGIQENRRPISIAYLGPSVTTYENNNPAYRIYYIDGDHENTTREVFDHETWTFDLDVANKNDQDPKWYRLYNAKSAYNMTSLRPSEWSKLIDRFVESPDLLELYYKYYYRDSPKRPQCDKFCKLEILCDMRSARSHERHNLCHDLELIIGS